MMLAVAAVLDIVQIVAGFLTEQPQLLGTRHVELLLTARLVALHAGTCSRTRPLAHLLADVTSLVIPLLRN